MNCTHRVSATSLLLAAGLAGSLTRTALAQGRSALNWNSAGGGAASTSANWSPVQVPTASDDLTFDLPTTYTVTYSNLVTNARTHTYKIGAVTLSLTSPHFVTSGITVGDVSGDNAAMTLTTGTLTSSANFIVGDNFGCTGVLNVNDEDADLIINGAAADLWVGNGGNGTLNITNGGRVQVADLLLAGKFTNSVASVNVSGFHTLPNVSSVLQIVGPLGSASAIGDTGDATLSVLSGGQATFGASLNIATGSASTSSATVAGLGLSPSTLSVGADLNISGNQIGTLAAGTGTLTLNTNGVVNVTGTTNVGNDPDGGTGTLNVFAGTLTTHSLIVNDAHGTLNHTDGDIVIDGGIFNPPGIALTVSSTSGSPLIKLLNGASTTLAGISFGLRVGSTGQGQMFVVNGSSLTVSGATLVGDSAGSNGTLLMSGGGAQLGAVTVGNNGVGLLTVAGGSTVNTSTTLIGALASGSGTVQSNAPSAILNIGGNAFVGGNSSAAAGTGVLRVQNGGLIHITGDAMIWDGGGSLLVDNATLSVEGTLTLRGAGTMTSGTVNVGDLHIADTSLVASGVINGRILMGSAGSNLTAGGDLVVGDAFDPNAFDNLGTFTVGSHAVTLLDGNVTGIGNTTIAAAGTLIAPNGIRVSAGRTLTGVSCTVDADVEQQGTIASGGTGITFKGIVSGVGQGITGATTHYLQGGGFTGSGIIATLIDADAQAVFTNTGVLTMGNSASGAGVLMGGTLHCGSGTVTLLDSNGVGLGILTDLAGGTLVRPQNLTVNAGKTIEGTGTVQTPLLTLNGAVKPADLPATGAGRGDLHVTGAVTLSVNDTYFCDIDPGADVPASDRIFSTGVATIGGALNVGFIHGYTPVASHIFDIVIGSSRVGTFSSLVTPPLAFGPAHVEYLPDRARLVLCYANCDSSLAAPTLNVADFSCFLQKYAAGDPYANCDSSTAAPILNVADFSCFLQKYANGCS